MHCTGNETLRIVNDPRGALSKAPTNTFTIRNVNGTSPSFTGVKLKYSHRNVLARGRKESFTILAPGDSIRVEHDRESNVSIPFHLSLYLPVSKAYNFTTPGAGPYTFAAKSSVFHYVDAKTNQTQTLQARVSPHRAIVTGQLAVGHRKRYRSPYAKRAEFESCSAEQSAAILEATKAAKTMTGESLGFVNCLSYSVLATDDILVLSIPLSLTAIPNGGALSMRVGTKPSLITSENSTRTISAPSPTIVGHATTLIALLLSILMILASSTFVVRPIRASHSFSHIDRTPGAFWNSELTGEDSKAGTLVHEASHFAQNGATEDNIYGREDCAQLAKTHPGEAVGNADSHEYFAEDSPTTPKKS